MWRSAHELEAELKAYPDPSGLGGLYFLSAFWRDAVYAQDYIASEEWNSILRLTQNGDTTLKELYPCLSDLPPADVNLAYFAKFFHHDLFCDPEGTDSAKIRDILQRELLERRIRLPYRFGRLLYDRFNDNYSDTRTDHLMNPEVQRLLQDTPFGVYQLGTLLSGPLGILDSQESAISHIVSPCRYGIARTPAATPYIALSSCRHRSRPSKHSRE